MADNYTLQVNHQTEDGKSVPVTISVPKDKLTFKQGKIVDADIDFLMRAAKQTYDSARSPNEAGIGAPKVNAPMQTVDKYRGMRVLPSIEDKGSLLERLPDIGSRFWEGIKSGVSGIMSTVPGHAGGEVGEPIDPRAIPNLGHLIAHPIDSLQNAGKFGPKPQHDFALNDLPIISDIDRLRRGDVAGEVGQLLPSVLGNAALSPKVRAGASGGVKAVYENPPEMRRFGPAGVIGAGAGYAAHPNYSGIMGGSLVGGGLEAAVEGAVTGTKGAIKAAKDQPWMAPETLKSLQSFLKKDPGQPSPALLPESTQFNMPGRTIPPQAAQLNAGPEISQRPMLGPATQQQMPASQTGMQTVPKNFDHYPTPNAPTAIMPEERLLNAPETGPARQMPPITPVLPDINPPMPLALTAGSTEPIRTSGAIPLPEAHSLPTKVSTPAVSSPVVSSPPIEEPIAYKAKQEEPTVIPKAPEKKLTWSGVQSYTYKRPGGTSVADIQEHFGATGEEAKAILSEMKDEGLVHNKGGKWYEGKEKEKPKVEAPKKKEAIKVEKPAEEVKATVAQDPAADPDVEIPQEKKAVVPEMQAKYDRRDALQEKIGKKEVLSNKDFNEWKKLDQEIINHEKVDPTETEEAPNSITSPETAEGSEISHEELYKVADALGLTATPLARTLIEKGYKVAPSKFGTGKWGLERVGKKELGSLLDQIGEKKLTNILELLGKRSSGLK